MQTQLELKTGREGKEVSEMKLRLATLLGASGASNRDQEWVADGMCFMPFATEMATEQQL